MANKPKYIIDLENDMTTMKSVVHELKDNDNKQYEIQGQILAQLQEIKTCLKGTEFDTNGNGHGGGVVKRVGRLEERCSELRTWKTSVTAKAVVLVSVITGALGALWGLFISQWDNIFGK